MQPRPFLCWLLRLLPAQVSGLAVDIWFTCFNCFCLCENSGWGITNTWELSEEIKRRKKAGGASHPIFHKESYKCWIDIHSKNNEVNLYAAGTIPDTCDLIQPREGPASQHLGVTRLMKSARGCGECGSENLTQGELTTFSVNTRALKAAMHHPLCLMCKQIYLGSQPPGVRRTSCVLVPLSIMRALWSTDTWLRPPSRGSSKKSNLKPVWE